MKRKSGADAELGDHMESDVSGGLLCLGILARGHLGLSGGW